MDIAANVHTPPERHGSPFAPMLDPLLDALPQVLRDHYLVSADACYCIVLTGHMDRIWHRPAWLWPFFWLLTSMNLLFPETGSRIPATMSVMGHTTAEGSGYQTWERTFQFPPTRHFNAIMAYDPMRCCVVEQLGPGHRLHMGWQIRFYPPTTISISTTTCIIQLGRWRIPLPSFLYPSVHAIETAVLERPDTIHIDLTMTHPWFGPIFGYEGTFQLTREAIERG